MDRHTDEQKGTINLITTLDSQKSTTNVSVGGIKTNALIDNTGANISVMNKQFLNKTPYSTNSLKPSDIESVIAVNGNHVKVLGKLELSITIGTKIFITVVYEF